MKKVYIVTDTKVYVWRPYVLLRNLGYAFAFLIIIASYLYISHLEYQDLISDVVTKF